MSIRQPPVTLSKHSMQFKVSGRVCRLPVPNLENISEAPNNTRGFSRPTPPF